MNKNDFWIHGPTLELIITEVSRFDAGVIAQGDNDTQEQQLVNKFAEGTVQGYKDAVKQIVDFLKDLRNSVEPRTAKGSLD